MSMQIDKVLEASVTSGRVAGVTATVGTATGVIYEGAAGVRDVETGAKMTTDTVLWIASMTKAVTATAAMQLVERGKLSLDDPAKSVLPWLGDVQVLEGFDTEGAPLLRAPRSEVTLRNLLTHTSGYGYDTWSEDLVRYQKREGIPGVRGGQNISLTTPLLFDPGSQWMYGIGLDWVGKLVEEVGGTTLGSYFETNIFEPLAMSSTAFAMSDDMNARKASMHVRGNDGSYTVLPFEMPSNPEFENGGGGLYSTVTDYLRFTRAILNSGSLDGNRVLEPETVAEMSRNSMGDIDVVTLESAIPAFSNDANLFPGMVQKWGLSFLINTEDTTEGRSAGSLAWAGLANSYFWIDPAKDVCGIWATQLFPFADGPSLQCFREFEAAAYESLT